MLAAVVDRRDELAELCRRYGVVRLEVFGSAARGADFDPPRSDIDFLIDLGERSLTLTAYLDLKEELEALFGRSVDLIERKTIEQSRNYIRRKNILGNAEVVYAD
jgi:predicted nucleotidyltransferase